MSTLVTATVKSNTSGPVAFQNTSGTEIGTLCRAWVNFNGTGTVAIRAAFNVSSITDHGIGAYTINFINALPDANYSLVGTAGQNGTGIGAIAIETGTTSPSTTAVRVFTRNFENNPDDFYHDCVSIFR